jgi:hypothetical protein
MSDGQEAVLAFPRGVCDPLCPQEHAIETTTDHRLLWHLESVLAVSGTTDYLRDVGRDLHRYLNETCQHHWHEYAGDDDIPAHRQCLWCNDVIWSAVPGE